MKNLYRQVAVGCVCTALNFVLVANKEAEAAVFTLRPTRTTGYTFGDLNQDRLVDTIFGGASLSVGIRRGEGYRHEYRALYEFNLANLSLAPNTAISSAIFGVKANNISYERFSRLNAYGYIGNGQTDVSDFNAGEYLNGQFLYNDTDDGSGSNSSRIFNFNVLPFISQRIENNDTFAGFSLRSDDAYLTANQDTSLTIITVDAAESVPEPTTILTAAVALGWGGWLKRKNSSQQDKTKSQG
jgi:hypothetical protein